MRWSVTRKKPSQVHVDLLVLGVYQAEDKSDLTRLDDLLAAIECDPIGLVAAAAFTAKEETWLLLPGQGTAATWLLLSGMGKREEFSLDRLRRVAGVAAAQARRLKVQDCAFLPPAGGTGVFDSRTVARCWVEGVELALFHDAPLKTEASDGNQEPTSPGSWRFVIHDGRHTRSVQRGLDEGTAYASGCLLARRLVNLPGNHLTPAALGEEARRLGRSIGLRCRVLGPAQLAKQGMGGLLAVARGSRVEPRLIVLETKPADPPPRRPAPLVALVGKGITFDAGGISLKPPGKMDLMKTDMAGAAAVLGAALTVARLRLKVRMLIVIPAAENLPDGAAVKPGDVITMAAGKTVEVINTDAEGRLILADALHYVCRREPDYLIDAATLTGSCAVALGEHFAGAMGTSADLLEILGQAGGETFERVWQLPLVEEHHKAIESPVADLKNLGGRHAGMSTAAAFLAAFVPETIPWAHLDIAGPVWTESAGPLGPKGATGYGSRLLARAVEILVS